MTCFTCVMKMGAEWQISSLSSSGSGLTDYATDRCIPSVYPVKVVRTFEKWYEEFNRYVLLLSKSCVSEVLVLCGAYDSSSVSSVSAEKWAGRHGRIVRVATAQTTAPGVIPQSAFGISFRNS